jgi:hypothetical protein
MARIAKIILRNGITAPSAGDFDVGEPAWDRSNGKLYVKDGAGAMIEIGAGAAPITDYGSVADAVTASFDYGALV